MLLTVWLGFCYSMAKPPDWAMESWTALNIKEFTLFDVSGPLCEYKRGKKSHDHDKDRTVHVRVPEAGNTKQIYMRAVNLKLRPGDESRFGEPAWSSG